MSNVSLPGLNRKEEIGWRRWRWAILFGAVIAAVMWRTQSALATVPGRAREALDDVATGVRDRFGGNQDQCGGAAVADRPETGVASGAGDVLEAGTDAGGTFRPTHVESDKFGVVVTGQAAAGLEAAGDWVKGDGSDICPGEHPIKGNASSRIYHQPGEPSYAKTIAGFCFATEADAQAAGYRARAK